MAVPRIILDGAQAYGTTVGSSGTITINAVAYIVNSVTPRRNSTRAEDRVADGGPGRARDTADFDECDLELQLATSATASPKFGDTFSMTLDSNYGSETWYVGPVSPPQSNEPGQIRTVSITAHKVNNTGAYSTVN